MYSNFFVPIAKHNCRCISQLCIYKGIFGFRVAFCVLCLPSNARLYRHVQCTLFTSLCSIPLVDQNKPFERQIIAVIRQYKRFRRQIIAIIGRYKPFGIQNNSFEKQINDKPSIWVLWGKTKNRSSNVVNSWDRYNSMIKENCYYFDCLNST